MTRLTPLDLEESRDLSEEVRGALSVVAQTDAYLEAPDGCLAIAAAAVVAVDGGTPADVPDKDRQWIAALVIDNEALTELAPVAAAALDRVRGKDSELLELSNPAQETNVFLASVEGIRRELPLSRKLSEKRGEETAMTGSDARAGRRARRRTAATVGGRGSCRVALGGIRTRPRR